MITDIQNFENAARIATADALFSEGDGKTTVSVFRRWCPVLLDAISARFRGAAGVFRT